MNKFIECYNDAPLILTEGSVGLRITNEFNLQHDNQIMHACHIYNSQGRKALEKIYGEHLQIAQDFSLPVILATNTRRANKERVLNSSYKDKNVMSDYADFLREIIAKYNCEAYIGGYIGCKGDGYTGKGCLSQKEAEDFHSWQIELFKEADIDFLFASLMPAVEEILGMVKQIEINDFPYLISFMIKENGNIADGHTIHDAISIIDNSVNKKPICYMTNCVHPKILKHALRNNDTPLVRDRFKGIQANAAYLPSEKLDKLSYTVSSAPDDLANEIVKLNNEFKLKINGGCCGTNAAHIKEIAKRLNRLFFRPALR